MYSYGRFFFQPVLFIQTVCLLAWGSLLSNEKLALSTFHLGVEVSGDFLAHNCLHNMVCTNSLRVYKRLFIHHPAKRAGLNVMGSFSTLHGNFDRYLMRKDVDGWQLPQLAKSWLYIDGRAYTLVDPVVGTCLAFWLYSLTKPCLVGKMLRWLQLHPFILSPIDIGKYCLSCNVKNVFEFHKFHLINYWRWILCFWHVQYLICLISYLMSWTSHIMITMPT